MTRRRWLIITAIVFALAVVGFLNLPGLLIARADSGPADGILYLAVDPYSKSDDFVADLYRRKAAPEVVCASSQISHQVYQSDFTREHLVSMGIPESAVSSLHLPIKDCLAEISPVLREHVSRRGWKSVLVVVNPGGSRYAGWVLRRYFEPAGIEARVTYSPKTYADLTDSWWRTHWKAQVMV
ncbi:MAG: hypothetical protein IPM55_22005, partial [Acidobacteria bacterium]|nr:hypothetical protein [Acidobacteriota bacterium]